MLVGSERLLRVRTRALRLLACALGALAALAAAGAGRAPQAKGPAELEDAYPVEIEANGTVREFSIRAAPAR
jgi:hypothetical protein